MLGVKDPPQILLCGRRGLEGCRLRHCGVLCCVPHCQHVGEVLCVFTMCGVAFGCGVLAAACVVGPTKLLGTTATSPTR